MRHVSIDARYARRTSSGRCGARARRAIASVQTWNTAAGTESAARSWSHAVEVARRGGDPGEQERGRRARRERDGVALGAWRSRRRRGATSHRAARGSAARGSARGSPPRCRWSLAAASRPSFALTITPSGGSSTERELLGRDPAVPPVVGHRDRPVAVPADGMGAGHLDRDVPLGVGVDEVLARAPDLGDGAPERRRRPRPAAIRSTVVGRRPCSIPVHRSASGRSTSSWTEAGHARPARGRGSGRAASRAPRAGAARPRRGPRSARRGIPVTSSSVDLEQVLDVAGDVRGAPGVACRGAEHDPGRERQRDAADVVARRPQVHRESTRRAAAPAGAGRSPAAAARSRSGRRRRPRRSSRVPSRPPSGGTSRRIDLLAGVVADPRPQELDVVVVRQAPRRGRRSRTAHGGRVVGQLRRAAEHPVLERRRRRDGHPRADAVAEPGVHRVVGLVPARGHRGAGQVQADQCGRTGRRRA